jgi:adenosine deaminase
VAEFRGLQKGELHAHFNGCLPPDAIHRIATEQHLEDIPAVETLVVVEAVDGFQDYFSRWQLLRQLRLDAQTLLELADAVALRLADDGVAFAELRNSGVHFARQADVPTRELVAWLLESFDRVSAEHEIDLRLILSVTRHELESGMTRDLLDAVAEHHAHPRLVGVDLAGDELVAPRPDVGDFFHRVKAEFGLGVTIHAGEAGGVDQIFWALDACGADRLGHALALASSPPALERVLDAGVCVETCLTSNLMTSFVARPEDHPVGTFLANGVPFVLCTDNPAVHARWLSDEYAVFVEAFGRRDVIDGMYAAQKSYRFGESK